MKDQIIGIITEEDNEMLKMEDILIPGAKLEAFTIEETPELLEQIRKVQELQDKCLAQRIVTKEMLEQVITI